MPKSRQEKITSYEERIAQLEKQKKQEIQKMKTEERKARTKRLCSRHGLLEKFMPDLITITDEQFEEFIKRGINTSYGQKILAEIMAKGASQAENSDTAKTTSQQTENGNSKSSTGAGQSAEQTTAKSSGATQPNSTTATKTVETASQGNNNHNAKPNQTAHRNTAAEPDKSGGGATVTG